MVRLAARDKSSKLAAPFSYASYTSVTFVNSGIQRPSTGSPP